MNPVTFQATVTTGQLEIAGTVVGGTPQPATVFMGPNAADPTSLDIEIDTPPTMVFAGKQLGDTHTKLTIGGAVTVLFGTTPQGNLSGASAAQLAEQVPAATLVAALNLLLSRGGA